LRTSAPRDTTRITTLAVVGVFVEIPVVSEYAFWILRLLCSSSLTLSTKTQEGIERRNRRQLRLGLNVGLQLICPTTSGPPHRERACPRKDHRTRLRERPKFPSRFNGRITVQSLCEKYSVCIFLKFVSYSHPFRLSRGASRPSRTLKRDAMDAKAMRDEHHRRGRRSRVVLASRR
jgi:hypothetical protein